MWQQVQDNDPDQKLFVDLFPRLKTGNCTIADWKHLMKRKPTAYYLNKFIDAVRIFSSNADCDKYNVEKLNLLKSPITALFAKNSTLYGRSVSEDHFRGLMNIAYVSVNANINLTPNIWKK